MTHVTTPKEFFGFQPGTTGEIARWDKMVEYFYLLEKETDRIQVTNMGPSTLGHPFLKVIITSPENLENLETYRQISLDLADPRGFTQEELDEKIEKGKAVCVQSMSIHGAEIGPAQTSLNLTYDLVSSNDPEILNILENLIFVMVPCLNPDGQILTTDYYYSTKGTPYEGSFYPSLYHVYAGHDNNRDVYSQNLIESRYIGQILFREWMPQAYQDHHQMHSYSHRMMVAPWKDPIRPLVAPIAWREANMYGGCMAQRLESEGYDGIADGGTFDAWGPTGFCSVALNWNITGMLTETASANLATPKYIDPTQLVGDGDNVMPDYHQQIHFPNPWPGGWWRLEDIVAREYWAFYELLNTMAKNRKTVLGNMVKKANWQIETGIKSGIGAYLVPTDQHDQGNVRRIIEILLRGGVDVYRAKEDFTVNNTVYPSGTFIVPVDQPRRAVVMSLFADTKFPDYFWSRNPKHGCAHVAEGVATEAVSEFMNVKSYPANAPVEGNFEKLTGLTVPFTPAVQESAGYLLSGSENDSYKTVNMLLEKGYSVWRVNNCRNHDFYTQCPAEEMNNILKEAPTQVKEVPQVPSDMKQIQPLKVAIYQHYYTGCFDEGWLRLVFENYHFAYKTVHDKDIWDGLDDFDVLVLPDDSTAMLLGPENKIVVDPKLIKRLNEIAGNQPPEYRSGLGMEGVQKIAEFVERGGRLLAINQACDFAIDFLNLSVRNIVKGLDKKTFNTNGSVLRVKVDTDSDIGQGMPKQSLIFHWNGPAFEVTAINDAHKYRMPIRYEKEDILESGLLTGKEYISEKGALAICEKGKGQVVLYGFHTCFRGQTYSTYKLLFNMLYQ